MEIGDAPAVADAVMREYFFLQGTVEDFNKQVLEFKKWSVTIGIAALIAAYTKPVARSGRVGVLIAALSAIPFWLTETFWKMFQAVHQARIQDIESCIAANCQSLLPLQISTKWSGTDPEEYVGFWFDSAFDAHVVFPHLFLLAFGLVLYRYKPPHAG